MLEKNSIVEKSTYPILEIGEVDYFENEIELNRLLGKIQQNIVTIMDNKFLGTDIGEVLDYAVSSVGKMIRSRLIILFASYCDDFEEFEDEICNAAALVELVHLASLIHDDVIDDSNYRRNKKSVQSKFGKDKAVYAGDYIISKVYYYLAQNSLRGFAMNLVKSIEKMCIGEIGQRLCKYDSNVSLDQYVENIKGKTCSLFETACLLGASFSDFDKNTLREIKEFGTNFGLMFQLRDDLLDYTSNMEEAGKECNKDFLDGIYTYPVICLINEEKDNIELAKILEKNKKHEVNDDDFIELLGLIHKSGAIDQTKEVINNLLDKNVEILSKLKANSRTNFMSQSILSMLQI